MYEMVTAAGKRWASVLVGTLLYTTWKVIGKKGRMEEDKRGEIEKEGWNHAADYSGT
jgi:hypothetical protein